MPFSTHLQTVTEELWGLHLARLACIQFDPSLFASVSFRSTRPLEIHGRAPNSRNYKLLMLKLKSRKLWAYQGKTLSKRALHSSEQYIRPQVCKGTCWLALDALSIFAPFERPGLQNNCHLALAEHLFFALLEPQMVTGAASFPATSMEAAGWSTIITEMSSQ